LLFTQCQLPSTGTEVFTDSRFSTAARSATGLFQKIWIGSATPTVSPFSGTTEAFRLLDAFSVLKVELIGTVAPSVPSAEPLSVYVAPGFNRGTEVHLVLSELKLPDTLLPSSSFSVTELSLPVAVVTVTGVSGCTEDVPVAGTNAMFAALGVSDGVVDAPGLVEAPGVPLLCVVPGEDGVLPPPASVLLHAVPASSTMQIAATARPCFLTEPLTIPQISPVWSNRSKGNLPQRHSLATHHHRSGTDHNGPSPVASLQTHENAARFASGRRFVRNSTSERGHLGSTRR
jgi:hypothetical protein